MQDHHLLIQVSLATLLDPPPLNQKLECDLNGARSRGGKVGNHYKQLCGKCLGHTAEAEYARATAGVDKSRDSARATAGATTLEPQQGLQLMPEPQQGLQC